MGNNRGNNAHNGTSRDCEEIEPTTFRLKVVEHLSWNTSTITPQTYPPGHADNKPIAGRKFKIKMPDGDIIEKTTDENGIIEFTDQPPTGEFEVIFEAEDASLNSKYSLFYNRTAVVKTEM